MHEDLLGYLLGALDADEARRVEELLRDDAFAREELAELERALKPLEDTREPDELPPPDLIARTLANLPPLPLPDRDGEGTAELSYTAHAESSGGASLSSLRPLREEMDLTGSTSRRWYDSVATAAAAIIFLGLLLPSLAEGRFEARKVACQDQLRVLGEAITQFVLRTERAQLPQVAERGPEAFAGVYAVRLRDAGLLEDVTVRWCPSLDRPVAAGGAAGARVGDGGTDEFVTAEMLHQAPVNQLQKWQRFAGGHYAYTLGVLDGNRYGAPQYQGRAAFAVLADAPLGGYPDGGLTPDRVGHGGRGLNVLYEDGRVEFILTEAVENVPDHPLLNLRGEVEAGVNVDDAVLAPSWRAPFLDAPQR